MNQQYLSEMEVPFQNSKSRIIQFNLLDSLGMMAAVGAGYNKMKSQIPESIEVACHNSPESCTLSGPADDMANYIAQLKKTGMFAKLVNVANIAYHSRYIQPAAPALLKYLKEIIPKPKERSSRWISSSVIEANWKSDLARFCSAEYHTNNLLSSVLFEEASVHIPSNAIVIEIAPHGLLQAIVKKSLAKASHVPLTSKFDSNNLMYFLGALGKLYLEGVPIDLHKLYPSIEFPVARGTPAISTLIDWLREDSFNFYREMDPYTMQTPTNKIITVNRQHRDFFKLGSHKINNKEVVPSSFFLNTILDAFTKANNDSQFPMIVIEDFEVHSYAAIPESDFDLQVQILVGTGDTSITKSDTDDLLVRNKIRTMCDEALMKTMKCPMAIEQTKGKISNAAMLAFMKTMGAEKSPAVTSINNISIANKLVTATAHWKGNIGEFLTSILCLAEFYETMSSNELKLLHHFGEMRLNLSNLYETQAQDFLVEYDPVTKNIICQGINIYLIECRHPEITQIHDDAYSIDIEIPTFVPYTNTASLSIKEHINICTQLIIENSTITPETVIQVYEIGYNAYLHESLTEISRSVKYSGVLQLSSFESEKHFFKHGSWVLLQKNVWCVFGKTPTEEMLQSLGVINEGYILMPKNLAPKGEHNHTRIMFESLVDNEWQVLCYNTKKYEKRQYEVVNLNGNHQSLLEKQIMTNLDKKMPGTDVKKTVILWGEVESLLTVYLLQEKTEKYNNRLLLHFWLFQGQAPEFDTNDSDFKTQIERGVRMNISVGGVWGSLRLLPAETGCSTKVQSTLPFQYPLSVVAKSRNFHALGLNSVSDDTYKNKDEIVYDYVSSTQIGLGTYDPHTKSFNADDILTWERPNSWSVQEAATIPTLYSLASFILHHTHHNIFDVRPTILINRGLLPLSQALIVLAHYDHIPFYVSVCGEEEKKSLLKLFPPLNPENIFDCSSSAFYVDVLRKHPKGIWKVINNFEETQMIEACSKCVMIYGVLVYANESLRYKGATMGMLKFANEIVALGASSDILLNSRDEVKTGIRNHLQVAMDNGFLKPIQTVSVLPPSTLNTELDENFKSTLEKVVIKSNFISRESEKNIHFGDESQCHIIVEGKLQSDSSLDILEWLLKCGSRKVITFMRQTHPYEAVSLRLQSLKGQYKCAEIDIRSTNHLSSKANVDKFLNESPIKPSMIVFVGSGLREKIEMMNSALSDTMPACFMVLIGKGGENVCEERRKKSLPTLYVRCSNKTLESVCLSQYLDSLIKGSSIEPVVVVNKYEMQHGSVHTFNSFIEHIPQSCSELHGLVAQNKQQATFKEVVTASPKYVFAKEVYPVFIIPGLRPGSLDHMSSELFSPALEARLPSDTSNLEKIASELTFEMTKTTQNVFTLVADDWGGILALHVAAKLEQLSKKVTIILLDADPTSITRWARGLLKNELGLIGRYLKISAQDRSMIEDWSWKEKVAHMISKSSVSDEVKEDTEKGLNLIRNRLQCIAKSKPPAKKIQNKTCHLIRLASTRNQEHGLEHYLAQPPTVHHKAAQTVEEMINETVSSDVNTLHMNEYKQAANPPIEEYIGLNVVEKPQWQHTLISRVRDIDLEAPIQKIEEEVML